MIINPIVKKILNDHGKKIGELEGQLRTIKIEFSLALKELEEEVADHRFLIHSLIDKPEE